MKNFLIAVIVLAGLLLIGSYSYAAPFLYSVGGTGTTTAVSGQLRAMGKAADFGVATTTATCTGSASCSSFVVIGSTPISISATGGGASVGEAFILNSTKAWLVPSTTLGIIVSASSTFTANLQTSGLFTVGPGTPKSDIMISQNATAANRGLLFTGNSFNGTQTTDGVVLQLGNNTTGNEQLWFSQYSDLANVNKNSFRLNLGFDIPSIGGVNNTNTLNKNISFVNTASNMGVGFDVTTAVQADIAGKLHIVTGADATIGLIVQGNSGSQSGDLTQWRNSGSTVLSVVNSAGRFGVGTSSPSRPLSVQGAALFSGDVALAALTATGTITFSGLTGTQCLHEISGVVSGTGSDCGAGGGGRTTTASQEIPWSDCSPEATSTRFFIGGAFFAPAVIANTAAFTPMAMTWGFATSSAFDCLVHLPTDYSSALSLNVVYMSTSTTGIGVVDVDATSTKPTQQYGNTTLFTTMLAASTTAGLRITMPGTAGIGTSSVVSLTSIANLAAGNDLLIRLTRFGANAADTMGADLMATKLWLTYTSQ